MGVEVGVGTGVEVRGWVGNGVAVGGGVDVGAGEGVGVGEGNGVAVETCAGTRVGVAGDS